MKNYDFILGDLIVFNEKQKYRLRQRIKKNFLKFLCILWEVEIYIKKNFGKKLMDIMKIFITKMMYILV